MSTSEAAIRSVEAQSFPAEERTARILGFFDTLEPGERFRLRSSVPPRRLLADLQKDRKGLFEWSLIENGPLSWVVEILHRNASPGALREVNEGLAWDHDRLDALESASFAARSKGDFQSARETYAAFACGLDRHIGFEEEILFPSFEESTGLDPACGPTAVMRLEHGEIRLLLDAITRAIGDPASEIVALRRRFRELLAEHNEKEEVILYPGMDGLLTPEQSDALFARIQAYGI